MTDEQPLTATNAPVTELNLLLELHSAEPDSDKIQALRRLIVRTLFSVIETHIELLLQFGLFGELRQISARYSSYLDIPNRERLEHCARVLALSESTTSVDDKGRTKIQDYRIGFERRLLLSVKEASDVAVFFIDPKHEHGWNSFKDCLKLRDRLTHVRMDSNVHVSDDQMKNINETTQWWGYIYFTIGRRLGILSEHYERPRPSPN